MATLEKIRSKGVLLIIVIGIALFAFIIGDFLNSSGTFFGQSQMNVIEVNDEKIKIDQYQEKIDELNKVYQIQMNQSQLSEEAMEQIRQSVYDNIIREQIISSCAEKTGINVSSKELFDLVSGENIHPYIQSIRMFQNPNTGGFDKSYLLNFLNTINKKDLSAEEMEQIKDAKSYWMFWENLIKNTRLEEKYTTLLSKSLNTNSLEAKFSFENGKKTVDLVYITEPYSNIADSTIDVSKKELKTLYKKNKEKYKQESIRDIQAVSFSIRPSKDDYEKIENWINRLKDEFSTTNDIAEMVMSNSDVPYFNFALTEKDIDESVKSFAFTGKSGDILGPIFENDTYKMVRIIENGISAPDSVKIRHILLLGLEDSAIVSLSDSIINAIQTGANFESLVTKYSQNQNTAAKGGEVGWVRESDVEKEMIEPCFYGTKGNLFSVKTNNGTHIIELQEKTKNVNKVKLAILERSVSASSTTYSKIYNDAKDFIVENNSLDKFKSGAEKKGLDVKSFSSIFENNPKLGTIKDSRKIVRWAFENEVGNISDVFVCEDEFIVAAITKSAEKGYKTVEDVETELKAEIIKDKKAEIITKKLADELAQTKDLQKIASKKGISVDTLMFVNFKNNRTQVGYEPSIIGTAPFMNKGETSLPLKGKNGVYVINIINESVSEGAYDDKSEKMQLNSKYMYTIPQSFFETLKEKANVIDYRSRFF